MKGQNAKKALSAVLSAALMATAFAGCAKTASSSKPTESTPSTVASGTGEVKQHTLTAMVQENGTSFLFAERDKFNTWKVAEDLFKSKGLTINFEIIAYDQYDTTLTTSLASSSDLAEYVGITKLGTGDRINAVANGIFREIDDLIDGGDGTAKKFFEDHPNARNATAYNGKMYWMPDYQQMTYKGEPTNFAAPHSVLIREDWLKALNLEIPTTLDEFTAYLQACQDKDANGNGVKDEYYTVKLQDFTGGIAQWFGLPNDRFGINVATGTAYATWQMDGVKDYFKYMQELLNKNLISKDFIACESAVTKAAQANDQASGFGSYTCDNWTNANAVWRALMPIEAVKGIEPVVDCDPAQLIGTRAFAFTKNLKDPEAASILLDVVYSEKFTELTWWGVEGETFEMKDGAYQLLEAAKETNWETAAVNGLSIGRNLWGYSVLPTATENSIEADIAAVADNPAEADVLTELAEKSPLSFTTIPSSYMACATADEAAILNSLESNFKTLSREIAVKLYKGEIDIDTEWDEKVIAPLEAGGMTAILTVYQARADRFFGK